MFVVRVEGHERPDFKTFRQKADAEKHHSGACILVWRDDARSSALFEVTTDDPRQAVEAVKSGNATLWDIVPKPLTKEQDEFMEKLLREAEEETIRIRNGNRT